MLFQCWPTAYGAGPTLKQHWVKSSCFLCVGWADGMPSGSGSSAQRAGVRVGSPVLVTGRDHTCYRDSVPACNPGGDITTTHLTAAR